MDFKTSMIYWYLLSNNWKILILMPLLDSTKEIWKKIHAKIKAVKIEHRVLSLLEPIQGLQGEQWSVLRPSFTLSNLINSEAWFNFIYGITYLPYLPVAIQVWFWLWLSIRLAFSAGCLFNWVLFPAVPA